MVEIHGVIAREILDSRGNPTVEVEMFDEDFRAVAKVPSGASTGVHEALELRDNDKKRFFGKGVLKAVSNVNTKISRAIHLQDFETQQDFDDFLIALDGSENKSNLGANAMLGCSMAFSRFKAMDENVPLYRYLNNAVLDEPSEKFVMPVPFSNVINGGKHAGGGLDFQEYMIVPVGAKSFSEAARIVSECYWQLKGLIAKKFGSFATGVGDEGGFAPPMRNPELPLKLLSKVVAELGYEKRVKFAIDVAASSFFENKHYVVHGTFLTPKELLKLYAHLVSSYPIISIEDPFNEEAFEDFALLKKSYKSLQVVGDDLTVTNVKRIKAAIAKKSCNALLLKVNQIGTVSEAIDAAKLAMKNNWKVMVSHRSGETEDTFISDLSVGLNCGQIKLGAPCRSERVAKYNRLLKIEEELGNKARIAKL